MNYRFDLETTTVDDCRREIDRLRAELAEQRRELKATQAAWLVEVNKVARVRELCDNPPAEWHRPLIVAKFRAELEGNQS